MISLQQCLEDGLQQLVILGAGYDSRAYRFEQLRQPEWREQDRAKGVRVFEVDHPATQQVKISKVRKVLGELPEHVTYVGIDFITQTLEKRLPECGYDEGLEDALHLGGCGDVPERRSHRQHIELHCTPFRYWQPGDIRLYLYCHYRWHGEAWGGEPDAAGAIYLR